MSGLRGNPVEPGPHGRVRLEVEAALVRDVRVRVERDVREGQALADEVAPPVEVALHCGQRPMSGGLTPRQPVGELLGPPGVREPEPGNGDRGLVVVLLEEHPLQHLSPLVRVVGHEAGALAEVPEDRTGLSQRPPVVEHERRHAQRGIQTAEHIRSVRAVDDVECLRLVLEAEVREQQPHLVAVARDRAVVEEHRLQPIVRGEDPRFVLGDEAAHGPTEYLQAVTRLRVLARRYWFDAAIVVGLGISLAGMIIGQGKTHGPDGPLALDIVLAWAIPAPLLFRRRFPFGAPVAVGAAVVIATFADGPLVPYDFIAFLSGCAAIFLLALRPDRVQAMSGLALGAGVQAIVVHNDPRGQIGQFVFVSLVFGVVWTIGFTLGRQLEAAEKARARAAQAESAREEGARLAVAEERARIARELHDVVGHSVSVMTVQASGVRRLLRPDQQREREALLVVEQTGREALAEMRRMVGVLRRPEEAPALAPQPSLEHLDRLVEQAREAGLPVELRVEGDTVQLPTGLDLTAYRLVQEGLTNALKHSRARHAEVLVHYGDGQIELVVSDDGLGCSDDDGGGHGLVGMRERVSVYGGELEAGPRPEGGFRLRALLPLAS